MGEQAMGQQALGEPLVGSTLGQRSRQAGRGVGTLVVALLLTHAGTAFGDAEGLERDSDPAKTNDASKVTRLEALVLPTLAMADNCTRDADLVSCETGRAFLAFEFASLFPLLPKLRLGPFLTIGFEGGARGAGSGTTSAGDSGDVSYSSQFGLTGAELRFLPFDPTGFWLSGRAGFAGVRDVTSVEAPGYTESSSSYVWGPSVGGGLGYDLGLGDSVGLSFALVLDYVVFPGGDMLPEPNHVEWYAGPWFALGLGMFFDV